jgi:hypothetical protein
MGSWNVPAHISGQVVVSGTGAGLSAATINLSGCASSSTTTDASGNYAFDVPAGGNCTVAPAAITRCTFSPTSRNFNPANGNLTGGFTATLSVSATLTDTTRSGTAYRVGDSFTLAVAGPPNRPVTVIQTFNGVPGSETQVGTTDSSGAWPTSGTWTYSNAGTYSQVWKVAGVAAPTLNFTVSPLVVLTVPGRTGTAFHVGDHFTIVVTGQANQTVTVNQNSGGDVSVGSTNGSGTYSTSGTWTSGNIGSYTQVWKVGGLAALPTLTFTVSN